MEAIAAVEILTEVAEKGMPIRKVVAIGFGKPRSRRSSSYLCSRGNNKYSELYSFLQIYPGLVTAETGCAY
jgi:hypothetical protein